MIYTPYTSLLRCIYTFILVAWADKWANATRKSKIEKAQRKNRHHMPERLGKGKCRPYAVICSLREKKNRQTNRLTRIRDRNSLISF